MANLQHTVAEFPSEVPADLSKKQTQDELSPLAIEAFLKMVSIWRLENRDARQLLGGIPNDVYNQLKTGSIKTLDQDKLTRISLLLGIFKALNNLYFEELEFADTWVTALNNNAIFGGKSPLIYMVQGGLPAIILVRQLLEARCIGLGSQIQIRKEQNV